MADEKVTNRAVSGSVMPVYCRVLVSRNKLREGIKDPITFLTMAYYINILAFSVRFLRNKYNETMNLHSS